jgi:hypothetical protein
MHILKLIAAASVATLMAGSAAEAAVAWEFITPGNANTDGTWDFATAFTVNSAVTVTGLGYYADPVTHNADGNQVAFYQCANATCTSTGTLLTSTTVTNAFPVDGHFRFVTVAPITLVVGDTYEVAGVSNADNYTWDDTGFHVNSAISLLPGLSGQDARWQAINTPSFLTTSGTEDIGGEDGFWGPNVFFGTPTFTGTVPEPATWAMFILGFGAIGFMLRTARRRNAGRAA